MTTATNAKDQLASLLEIARSGVERVVIEKHGKRTAALVSIADLERLERLDAVERAARRLPLAGTLSRYDAPDEPVAEEWSAAVSKRPSRKRSN